MIALHWPVSPFYPLKNRGNFHLWGSGGEYGIGLINLKRKH
jgi:hypothetical protein